MASSSSSSSRIIALLGAAVLIWCSVVVAQEESCASDLVPTLDDADVSYCAPYCDDEGFCSPTLITEVCCSKLKEVDTFIASCPSICLTRAVEEAMNKVIDWNTHCNEANSHITLEGLKNCTVS